MIVVSSVAVAVAVSSIVEVRQASNSRWAWQKMCGGVARARRTSAAENLHLKASSLEVRLARKLVQLLDECTAQHRINTTPHLTHIPAEMAFTPRGGRGGDRGGRGGFSRGGGDRGGRGGGRGTLPSAIELVDQVVTDILQVASATEAGEAVDVVEAAVGLATVEDVVAVVHQEVELAVAEAAELAQRVDRRSSLYVAPSEIL